MKKIAPKLIAVFATAVLCNVSAFADTRIRFAKGRNSTTVPGRVGAGGRVCYVAGAQAGQQVMATVSSRSGKACIFESGEITYNYEVEQGGDQSICVDNLAGA